jgi:hypothetical protein
MMYLVLEAFNGKVVGRNPRHDRDNIRLNERDIRGRITMVGKGM